MATPLGHLGDISLRALDAFRLIPVIACEDTRVTATLLRGLGIALPELISVREHNEARLAARIVERIAAGQAVAYVSDAGTPGISDPGARLVEAVRAAGLPVIPIPGPSAVTAALSITGFQASGYRFVGFVPRETKALHAFVDELGSSRDITVFFESPHRIERTLTTLAERLASADPQRRLLIAREMTKRFEQTETVTAGQLHAWIDRNRDRLRGEFVIVVDACTTPRAARAYDSELLLRTLLEELPPAKAAKLAAKLTGSPRAELYARAESIRQSASPD